MPERHGRVLVGIGGLLVLAGAIMLYRYADNVLHAIGVVPQQRTTVEIYTIAPLVVGTSTTQGTPAEVAFGVRNDGSDAVHTRIVGTLTQNAVDTVVFETEADLARHEDRAFNYPFQYDATLSTSTLTVATDPSGGSIFLHLPSP